MIDAVRSELSEDSEARAKSGLALALAGRALDASATVDLELGAALLERAALLMTGPSIAVASKDVMPASDALVSSIAKLDEPLLVWSAGGRRRALELGRLVSETARGGRASLSELIEAELFVERLVNAPRSGIVAKSRSMRRRRWWMAGLLLACAAALAVVWVARRPYPGRFHVSSTFGKFPSEGSLGDAQAYENLFHTAEEDGPWVEIDLGRDRQVSRVGVENRNDCCTERAVPLVVEVRSETGEYHEVARKKRDFVTWTARFPQERVRYVRLSVPRVTLLHLQSVDVR